LPPARTKFEFAGPVLSGATLGTWSHVALGPEDLGSACRWNLNHKAIELQYRADLPTRDQARSELARWQAEERSAQVSGDPAALKRNRAMAERFQRLVNRLNHLPPGDTFPLPVWLLQLGGAIWVFVEGEHYHLLQRRLRDRFKGLPVLVATLANGARPAYLPTRDAYDRGIYQESIAVLAAGSLERVIEAIASEIRSMILHERP
jgi:hypothetical protein